MAKEIDKCVKISYSSLATEESDQIRIMVPIDSKIIGVNKECMNALIKNVELWIQTYRLHQDQTRSSRLFFEFHFTEYFY